MSVKIIEGFGKFYCVSDDGKVWSRHVLGGLRNKRKIGKWRRIKSHTHPSGHLTVSLCLNKKQNSKLVHRLVLEAFVGPCPEGMECRHLDGNPTNNNFNNLKWGTAKENGEDKVIHGTSNRGEKNSNAKLTENKIMEIRNMYDSKLYTQRKLAEIFDVSERHMRRIVCRKSWNYI